MRTRKNPNKDTFYLHCFIYISLAKHCWVIKLGEFQSDQKNFASKNNSNSSKAFQLMCPYLAKICWGRSTGSFIYSFVIQVIKHCVAKVLLTMWEMFLNENNRNYNSYRFSYKFAFILFLSFLINQKQESGQVGGLAMKIYFCFLFRASHVLLQSLAKFNRLL